LAQKYHHQSCFVDEIDVPDCDGAKQLNELRGDVHHVQGPRRSGFDQSGDLFHLSHSRLERQQRSTSQNQKPCSPGINFFNIL